MMTPRRSIKQMLSRMIALVTRVFEFETPLDGLQRPAENDNSLIVNTDLEVACRIWEDSHGRFNLLIFDQITGNELQMSGSSFPNRALAVVEAHRKLHINCPVLVEKSFRYAPSPAESTEEDTAIAVASGM